MQTTAANGAPRPLDIYDFGRTTSFASQYDQRFSYCLYVPPKIKETGPAGFRVLVAVHGTARGFQRLCELFAALAEEHDLIVLAPFFPCAIGDGRDRDNYKYIEYQGIRFDLLVLSMIEEVEQRYRLERRRVLMHGFSGGAHFCHRFFFLHAAKVAAVSVCAPGSITRLDESAGWWVGVRDAQQRFGCTLDYEAMRSAAVHLAVGAEDSETWEITHSPGSAHWMEGANASGRTRIERAASLHRNLLEHDIPVHYELLPGVAHHQSPMAEAASRFFRLYLGNLRVDMLGSRTHRDTD